MSAEWPTLDDVALSLTRPAFSPMDNEELGAFVRLAWSIACSSVNTYSPANLDPSLPDDDAMLARMAWCSGKEWQRVRPAVMGNFVKRRGRWCLADEDLIRITRTSSRNPIPTAVKSAALARAGQRCAYCGDMDGPFHFDHLYPVAKGGTDDAHNIVIACQSCNLSKRDRTILEWVAYLRNREGSQ